MIFDICPFYCCVGKFGTPDIIKYEKEYRLYYSASTFGSQYSAIGLAVSSSPEGPFEHRGIVIETTPESPVKELCPSAKNPVPEEKL